MKATIRFALAAALAVVLASPVWANEFFVDKDFVGTSLGTLTAPDKTIAAGLARCVLGRTDTVTVRGSAAGDKVYTVAVTLPIAGNSLHQLMLRGYPGERPAIAAGSGIRLDVEKSYWTFDNLILDQNAVASDCVQVGRTSAVRHITFSNCEVRDGTTEGFQIYNARDIVIQDCNVHDFFTSPQADHHGIMLDTGDLSTHYTIDSVTVQRCVITKCSGDATQIFGVSEQDTSYYARHVWYLNNVFRDGTAAGSGATENAIDMKAARDVVIRGNEMSGYSNNRAIIAQKWCQRVTIENNTIHGGEAAIDMRVEGSSAHVFQQNHRIVGNLIYDMGRIGSDFGHSNAPPYGSALYQVRFDGCGAVTVANNTIIDGGSSTSTWKIESTYGDTGLFGASVFVNNLNYGVDNASGTETGDTEFHHNGWYGGGTGGGFASGTGDRTAGLPGFTDAINNIYLLANGADAIDTGRGNAAVGLDSCGSHADLGYKERCSATYYVDNVTGQDGALGHDGSTPLLAWRTIGYANGNVSAASAANGDILVNIIASQTPYTEAPAPAQSASGGKRFYYHGSVVNPAATKVQVPLQSKIYVTKPYLSIVGLRFQGDLVLQAGVVDGTHAAGAAFDSIRYCTSEATEPSYAGLGLELNASYAVLDHCTVNGRVAIHRNPTATADTVCNRPEIQNSKFPTMTENGLLIGSYGAPSMVDSLLFHGNVLDCAQTTAGTIPTGGWYMQNARFRQNKTRLTSTIQPPAIPSVGPWTVRDSSFNVAFRRDTVLSIGPTVITPWSFGTKASSRRTVDSCYWQASNGVLVRDQMLRDSIFRSVIVSDLAAVTVEAQVKDLNLVDHNTLVGNAASMPRGVINFSIASWDTSANQNDLRFTNNILYAGGLEPIAGCGTNAQRGAYWGSQRAQIAYALTSDFNLYSFYGHVVTAGDKSIGWKDSCSTIGDNNLWSTALQQEKVVSFEADSNSVYGSPQFLGDSLHVTPWATESYAIDNDSRAKATGSSSTDIGAISYVASSALVLDGEQVKGGQALSFINLDNTDVSQDIPIKITNAGVADLVVTVETSWTSDPYGLQPSPGGACDEISFDTTTLTVAGGATGTITVSYASTGPHYESGVLQPHDVSCNVRLVTNAPGQPIIYLFITGHNGTQG